MLDIVLAGLLSIFFCPWDEYFIFNTNELRYSYADLKQIRCRMIEFNMDDSWFERDRRITMHRSGLYVHCTGRDEHELARIVAAVHQRLMSAYLPALAECIPLDRDTRTLVFEYFSDGLHGYSS